MIPPGPSTPAMWQTYRFVTDPEAFVRGLQKKHGDVVRFRSMLGHGVAVLEPELAREVFAAPPATFDAPDLLQDMFGSSAVIAVAGEPHRRLRKLLNPRFHGTHIKSFLGAMQRAVRANLEAFAHAAETKAELRMTDVSQALTLDVILETVFGAGELDRPAARAVLRDAVHSVTPMIIGGRTLHKPWFPPWRRFTRAREAFDRWVDSVVAARRARGAADLGDDVLGVILSSRYEDGQPMTDAEVRDQLFTLLLAGHETSAIALAWAVYYLFRDPSVLAQLRAELDALGGDASPEAITKSRYLNAVISESLRIEPIVTDVLRLVREPLSLGGKWTVPAGYVVVVMLVAILRDERTFPEPGRFRPERFLERRYGPSEFLPFGGGARRCLGAAFAEAELAIALAEIAKHWNVELASSEPERSVRRNVTMGPKHGVRVRVTGRRSYSAAPE